MWDVPRYRIRAYVQGLRRARAWKALKPQNSLRIRRTQAEILVTEGFASPAEVVTCRLILNELTPAGVHVYSSRYFVPGQIIALTVHAPRFFYVQATVVSCAKRSLDHRVLSDDPQSYRVDLKFLFASNEERRAVREYCQDFLGRYLYGNDH
jgi:hypothetical protein